VWHIDARITLVDCSIFRENKPFSRKLVIRSKSLAEGDVPPSSSAALLTLEIKATTMNEEDEHETPR
jgi:hypothetical protein